MNITNLSVLAATLSLLLTVYLAAPTLSKSTACESSRDRVCSERNRR
ncbi:MAG: hypothetical protein ACXWTN_11630 [Methylosarcina sp.]